MKANVQEKKGLSYYAIIIGLALAVTICILTISCAGTRSGCPATAGFNGYHK